MEVDLDRINEFHAKISDMRPFTDKYLLNRIKNFYKIECTWASNAIEGISYTISETKVLLEDGLTAGGKPIKDALAIVGHAKAYDYMFTILDKDSLTEENILDMHYLLKGGLENNDEVGKYRTKQVFITGSQYTTPDFKLVPAKMKKLIASQDSLFAKFHPVVAAAKFHKEFVFVHPFLDGNGRIARLAMNCLLIQRGFLPVSIPPVLRHEYIQSLEAARHDDSSLLKLIVRAELEAQKECLPIIELTSEIDKIIQDAINLRDLELKSNPLNPIHLNPND